jgi:hypothetical protein
VLLRCGTAQALSLSLIVVLNDLIPHSLRDSISKAHFVKHLLWFAIGLLRMGTLSSALPHEEVREAEGEHIEALA